MRLQTILENRDVEAQIFRGLKLPSGADLDDVIQLSVRQDRKPKDASILGSMLFNHGIQCRFGVSDIRKRSMFAACSENIARSYTDGPGTGVVQAILPGNALVVYNRSVSDSLNILERRDVKDFAMHMGNYIDDPTVDQYLGANSGQLFHDLVAEAITDGEEFVEVMRLFEDLAINITDGYIAERASEFSPSPMDYFECMVYGVSTYNAKVIDVMRPVNREREVDDDNIPF